MSPSRKSVDFEQKYYKKQNELQKLGYNELGARRVNLNEYAGRNYQGHQQYQQILGEYSKVQGEPINNMYAGPGNINIGERQR